MIKRILSAMLLIIAFSCQVAQEPENKQLTTDPVKAYIISLGFEEENIVDEGDQYVVEGDIIFPKDMFTSDRESNNGRQEQAQWTTLALVRYDKQSTIRISVLPAYSQPGRLEIQHLMPEIQAACDQLNAVPNSNLHFTVGYNLQDGHDISMVGRELTSRCGQAGYPKPTTGDPGGPIDIDSRRLDDKPFEQRVRTIMHEIGHTVGLAHTNYAEVGDGGVDIPGASGPDENSVMNAGECGIGATVLSKKDKLAIKLLYPNAAYINNGITEINTVSTQDWFSNGSANGTIRAFPGSVVSVTISAYGPTSTSTTFSMSGATLSIGNYVYVSSSSRTGTFTMPASGYVNWSGNFSRTGSYGSGHISVVRQ